MEWQSITSGTFMTAGFRMMGGIDHVDGHNEQRDTD